MSNLDSNSMAASTSSSTAVQSCVRVFLPPSSSSSASRSVVASAALDDDELKPTAEELKTAFRSSLLGRHGPDAPLLTRAMREREEQRLGLNTSKHRHWDEVKIRLRFSDRTMVESTFTETDTMDKVYAFLHSVLADEVKQKERVLYTAPPRVEYRMTDIKVSGKTLRQLGLIPSAVVNVKWAEERMNSNSFAAPIRQELKQQAQPLPLPPPSTDPTVEPTQAQPNQQPKPNPKWLKNIFKK